VIPAREVLDLRNEWQLRGDVIEKDYTLGWMLAAIAANDELAETWVFKGGTCLRKCYFETYRFSEDLDFTVINGGPEEPEDLVPIFGDIASWLYDHSGIQLEVDHRSFRRQQNRRAHATTVGRIGFRGATATPTLPRVRSISPATKRSSIGRWCDQSCIPTAINHYPAAACCRIRSSSCSA